MKKDEKRLLEDLSNLVSSKMDYSELSEKIDFSKYEKKKQRTFSFSKSLTLTFATLSIVLALVLSIVLIPDRTTNEINFKKYPNLLSPSYDGFIRDLFESNIGDRPHNNNLGPRPHPPVIDGYFYNENDYSEPSNKPGGEPELLPILLPDYVRKFECIYEVEYKTIENDSKYVAVYIDKKLASKIYKENKNVNEAPCADSLDIVNGSIVDWFYSNLYYDKEKVFWCQYSSSNQIYSEIENFVCVGVYQPQQRVIIREILSNNGVNIVDNVYTNLYFKNEGNECLSPVVDKAINKTTWYALFETVNETNKNILFNDVYSLEFNCTIDVEADTIKIETFAVQAEEELNKNTFKELKDYHIYSNSVIVENEQADKEFGQSSYITYKYKALIEVLQNLAK